MTTCRVVPLPTHQQLIRMCHQFLATSTCIYLARGSIIASTRRWGRTYLQSTTFRVFTLLYGLRMRRLSQSLEISMNGSMVEIQCIFATRNLEFGSALCQDCKQARYINMRSLRVTTVTLLRRLILTVLARNCAR